MQPNNAILSAILSFITARRVYIALTMSSQDVCLSVCLSHTGILSTLMDISSIFFENNNNININSLSLYWNQVDNRILLQWHTKHAATLMQDSTALYNQTQTFGTKAYNSTKYNTSLARSFRQLLSARCPQCRNLVNTNRNNEHTHIH